jgi:hypothetical protein
MSPIEDCTMKLVFGSAALLVFGLGFPAAAQQNDDAETGYAEAVTCPLRRAVPRVGRRIR